MRYVLIGNYGVQNLGDEALKEYFLRSFPGHTWQVVSARPEAGELSRLPLGLRSLRGNWRQTVQAIRESDSVVFGGGSLFTDTESLKACILWGLHAYVAHFLKRPIILAFQGIGPFRTRIGEAIARWVASRAVFISVRDDASFAQVARWKLNTKVIQSFDPIFSLINQEKQRYRSQKVFIVIPRRNSGKILEERTRALCAIIPWERVQILSLQPSDPAEAAYCQSLATTLKADIVPIQTLSALTQAVGGASFVLSERYHGALAALALGIPFEVIPRDRKDKLASLVLNVGNTNELKRRVHEGEEALRKVLK
jgi:polysaccharide pyruvyl transferase WcaK-like protein